MVPHFCYHGCKSGTSRLWPVHISNSSSFSGSIFSVVYIFKVTLKLLFNVSNGRSDVVVVFFKSYVLLSCLYVY